MDRQSLFLWYLGAVAFGAIVAWTTISIFRRLVPKGTTRKYWSDIGDGIHGLFYGDEDRFWLHYGNVIRQSAVYIGRQLFGLLLAFAPLVLAFIVLGPWIISKWDRDAKITVHPPTAGTVSVRSIEAGDPPQIVLTLENGYEIALAEKSGSQVVCQPGRIACLILLGFGFTAVSLDQASSGVADLVIIRADHNDWNPLWPYLNDPEFLFFLSLSLCSVVLLVKTSPAHEMSSGSYSVSLVDYLLTRLATHGIRWMTRLGEWESRWNARRIAKTHINKPIFIAGLARSGTTILLEKIATIKGVATHRYRDFPFLMTPILWNRVLSLIGSKQKPAERPHLDSIQITRDSPDAFEEPIWQYYFPYVHDVTKSHVLAADVKAPGFARFYSDHIKKILIVRKGVRYVSKGNYNMLRMELISSIFPDARFIVPVRHPLTHINSLARQHELFVDYAANDPKVAGYLQAVGHYEFGPQRAPICVTVDGGQRIAAAWDEGNELLGYALQWADLYGHVIELISANTELSHRIQIVRFEDLCNQPENTIDRILSFTDLNTPNLAMELADNIKAPPNLPDFAATDYDACWRVTEDVARWYGYSRNPQSI